MVNKLIPGVLIFLLLLNGIAYACSKLDLTEMRFHGSSMSVGAVAKGSCSDSKHEICKTVRQRTLSIQMPQSGISALSSAVKQVVIVPVAFVPPVSFVSSPWIPPGMSAEFSQKPSRVLLRI